MLRTATGKTFHITFAVILLFAFQAFAASGNEVDRDDPAWARIEEILKDTSSHLRDPEIQRRIASVPAPFKTREQVGQIAAIDFLHDINACKPLVAILLLPRVSVDVQTYAVNAISDLPCDPLDVPTIDLLREALKDTASESAGGSEVRIPAARYQIALIRLVEKLTKLKFGVPDLSDQFSTERISEAKRLEIDTRLQHWASDVEKQK